MIDIKKTFLKLTERTYTDGTEDMVIKLLPKFKFNRDKFGNYYIIVKKKDRSFSDTMFTCHLDTVYTDLYYGIYEVDIKHVIDGDFIKTNEYTNLGADDKAGMVIMLNMINEKVPGLYYFFQGEETGRIGSSKLSAIFNDLVTASKLPKINRCIAFDRSGYEMVITHQKKLRCCSDEFANELAKQLNGYGFWYRLDTEGGRTDSYQFIDLVPECTNISVGYFYEHTVFEKQDIEFLELLSVVATKINWDNLPIVKKIIPLDKMVRVSSNCDINIINSVELNDNEFDIWYNEQREKSNNVENKTIISI